MGGFSMTSRKISLILMHAGALFALFLCPHFIPRYWLLLLTEALTLAIFAMSLDLIMGYAGIVSFGHAAFFGLGGYALGVTIIHMAPSVWLALAMGACISGCLALFVGVVAVRTRGIYFAILTLLFGEVIYRIVFHIRALGGSDGLIGIPVPDLTLLFFKVDMKKPVNFFYVTAAIGYLSFLFCRKLVDSPFGRVLRALRDNENRVPFLGFNVKAFKIISFAISGMLAGLGGALFSLFKTFADTSQLHFLLSGKVIIMDLIGGLGTLIGPVVGAIFLTFIETFISGYFESYHIITGAMFVLIVIFLPNGLVGLLRAVKKKG
jgi:branched-chain amino acid transport system permease protein